MIKGESGKVDKMGRAETRRTYAVDKIMPTIIAGLMGLYVGILIWFAA